MGKEISSNKISLVAATVICFNAMVGAGVLLVPTILSKMAGPVSVFTFIFSSILVLCLGLSLGRASEIYPGQGWSYLYPSKWAGHTVGLISAYMYIFGLLIAMGVLVQQAGIWVHKFIPWIPQTPLGIYIILILMILILAGAQISSWGQYLIGVCVVVPLCLCGLLGWLNFNPATLTPFMPHGFFSIFKAGPPLLFSFLGFECAASLYGIVKDPHKNVPKATIYSVIAVSIVYFLFVFGILYAVPTLYFAGGVRVPLVDVLVSVFPKYAFLGVLISIGATFAILGTLHSVLWAVGELLTSVVQKTKSKFIQTLINKGFWNSKISVLFCTAVILFAALLIQGEKLVSATVFLVVPAYTLSVMSLLFIKTDWKDPKNYITIVALFGGFLMIYFSGQSAIALAWDFLK